MTTSVFMQAATSRHARLFHASSHLDHASHPITNTNVPPKDQSRDLSSNPHYESMKAGAWRPADLENYSENIVKLDSEDVVSIEMAVKSFQDTGMSIPHVSPETFPLPDSLKTTLRSVSEIVHDGVGFATIRGIDPTKYTDEENAIIFNGLSSHVGCLRSTNKLGVSMSHLRDARKDKKPENRKDAELNASKQPQAMKFHADRFYGDVIAMYVKSDDAVGGEQYLASFPAIYNELLQTSPETIRILAKDWSWGKSEYESQPKSPVIFHADGRVIVQLIYRPFLDYGFSSAAEESALDAVQACAERLCIKLERQPGDLQFVNNFALLHARDKYTDSSSKGRHMLRLGLKDPERAWKVPEQYQWMFDELFQVKPEDQQIYPSDVDPWELTTASVYHHG